MKKIKFILVIFIIFYIDYISKRWVINNFLIEQNINITSMIRLIHLRNSGIAFGFFQNEAYWKSKILLTISTVFLCILFKICIKCKNELDKFSYSMILGGGIGNIYDRILYGSVTDFIDVHVGNWHWPVFNIADISISIGIIFLILKNSKNFMLKFK
ncbi:MAG: signal peptidase II [Wigglesworthia glossinidia]|nr:signal peptidase II [Wigglesworthia glossinidia]